jgi:protein-disulfide isomerase
MTFRRLLVFASALGVALAMSATTGVTPGLAQSEPATKADVDALKGDLDQIQGELETLKRELRAIRDLLARRGAGRQPARAPVVAKVSIDDDPILGRRDAPVTLVEFSDYQCPFCQRFFRNTLPALKSAYIDTGKVRYVFRDYPIDRIHPHARKAAEAANCAGDQGKYWEMHDILFQNQSALTVDGLKSHAGTLGIDMGAFEACLDSGQHADEVQKDFRDGSAAGVRGTPGFFLGKTGDGDAFEGTMIRGAQPFAVFRDLIERLLAEN